MGRTVSIILSLVIFILIAICIILACLFFFGIAETLKVCRTSQCLHDASRIKRLLNTSVDPCEDFYDFVCGGFKALPFEDEAANVLKRSGDDSLDLVRRILEKDKPFNSSAERKMRDYFRSCMDLTQTEEKKMTALSELMRNIGGYGQNLPIEKIGPNYFKEYEFDINDMLRYVFSNLSSYSLIEFDVRVSSSESKNGQLEANLWISGKFNKADCPTSYMYDNLTDYANEIGSCFSNDDDSKHFAADVVDVYKMFCESSDIQNKTYIPLWYRTGVNSIMFEELLKNEPIIKASKINWFNIMGSAFEHFEHQELKIDESAIWAMKMLDKVNKEAEPRKVRNFFLFFFLAQRHPQEVPKCISDAGFLGIKYKFVDRRNAMPMWKWCINHYLEKPLNLAMLALVENTLEQPLTKDKNLKKMVENVRNALIKRTLSLGPEWLDDRLKEVMENKVRNKVVMLAGPRRVTDVKYLENFYKHLDVDVDKPFLVNHVKAKRFYNQIKAVALKEGTIDYLLFIRNPEALFANAYNLVSEGGIEIFWPILQEPFYTYNSQAYLNYGGIGVVIGHEFGHDFDGMNTFGRWANETAGNIPALVKEAKCLVDHYVSAIDQSLPNSTDSDFRDIEQKRYVYQMQGISDVVGVKWSWEAYLKHVADQGREEETLPGLPYTQSQLFHMAFGQHGCSLGSNVHKTRVNGAASLNPYFAKAFSCPAGSPMNPTDRCDIW